MRSSLRPLLQWLLSALLLPCVRESLLAQDRSGVSTRVGYEYGVPLAIERYPGVANRFGVEGGGVSQNHTLAFQGELEFPGLFLDRSVMLLRVGMALSTGSFLSDEYVATNAVDKLLRVPVESRNRFTIRTSESMARLELLAAIDAGPGLRIVAGSWLGLRVAGSVIENEEIVSPGTAMFRQEESAVHLISAGAELRSNRFRGGVMAGVGTRLPLLSRIVVTPEAYARVDVESLFGGLGVRSLSGGIGIGFSIGPEVPAVAPPVVAMQPDSGGTKQPSHVSALAIDLYNADAAPEDRQIAPVHVGLTYHRTYLSISPLVLFERGSDLLSDRYLRAPGTDSAGAAPPGPPVDQAIFDILAERLREIPDGTIMLAGSAGADEPAPLAGRRSEQVRRHLIERHGIDPARIRIAGGRATGLRSGYDRAVEIIPSDPRLLAPLQQQRITRDYTGPRLGMSRSIEPSEAIASWTITIRQGDLRIARYSSGNGAPERIDAILRIDSLPADSVITPIVAELEVIDRNGITSSVRDELPLRFVGSIDDREIRSYLLLDPAIGGATNTINSALVSSIGATAHNGASITIAGPPRQGSEEWGAGYLAERILSALNKRGIDRAEIHITTDSTEQRYPDYARAVAVTLRQTAER